jgi:hypothetical protein
MTPPRGAKRPPPSLYKKYILDDLLQKIYFNGISDYWETGNEWDIDLSVFILFCKKE